MTTFVVADPNDERAMTLAQNQVLSLIDQGNDAKLVEDEQCPSGKVFLFNENSMYDPTWECPW